MECKKLFKRNLFLPDKGWEVCFYEEDVINKIIENDMKKIILFLIICSSNFCLAQWALRYPEITSDFINDIYFLNENDGFAVNEGGSIMKTTDGGSTWKIIRNFYGKDLTEIKFIDDKTGFILVPYSYVGDNIGLIYTTDGGEIWQTVNIGNLGSVYDNPIFLPISNSELLETTNTSGLIERLDNFYGNWKIVYKMPSYFDVDIYAPYGGILQFQKLGNKILALGSSYNAQRNGILSDSISFILESYDNGLTWDTLWCGLPYAAQSFHFVNHSLGWMGLVNDKIFKTTNGGITWFEQYSDSLNTSNIKSIYGIKNNVFAIDGTGKIIYSNNAGYNWQTYQLDRAFDNMYKIKFLNDTSGFVIGSNFWRTTNGGNLWNRVSKSLKGNLRKIDFANEYKGIGIGGEYIYGTTDGGYSWKVLLYNGDYFYGLDMLDSLNAWVVGYNSIYKSSNGGNTWKSVMNNNDKENGITFLDKNVGVVYGAKKISVTTDGGQAWNIYNISDTGYVSGYNKMKFTDPSHLWFVSDQGLWLSRDTAKTWKLFSIKNSYESFDFLDSLNGWVTIYGGQFSDMVYTSDGGKNWGTISKPYQVQPEDVLMYADGGNSENITTLVSGFYGSLFRFENNNSVSSINTFTSNTLFSFASYKDGNKLDIWLAGDGMTLLHNTIIITNIKNDVVNNDFSFKLFQNYPNPFNPLTTIKYQIPKESNVTIKVYDVLGKEITTLLNAEQKAGHHKVEWDGKNYASGIYFYRIRAGEFVLTKKMLLIK